MPLDLLDPDIEQADRGTLLLNNTLAIAAPMMASDTR